MTLFKATKACFRNYITFSGRAVSSEFWYFILFMLLGMILSVVVNSVIFGPGIEYRYALDANGQPSGDPKVVSKYTSGVIGNLFFLICAFPWLAVTWRRMHDTGKAGYLPFIPVLTWILLVLAIVLSHIGFDGVSSQVQKTGAATTPVSGTVFAVVLLALLMAIGTNIYWLTRPSQPGPNTYGPNPNEVPT